MSLLISHLEELQESGELKTSLQEVISIFLLAINDWSSVIINLDDYGKEVYKLIGGEVSRDKLEEYLSQIDYSKYAWQSESLCQLLDVFNYYEEGKLLKEIIEDVQAKIKEE
jgi:hypothetical protein